jgi:hypothetical protein
MQYQQYRHPPPLKKIDIDSILKYTALMMLNELGILSLKNRRNVLQ